jgi:hypothetical protein
MNTDLFWWGERPREPKVFCFVAARRQTAADRIQNGGALPRRRYKIFEQDWTCMARFKMRTSEYWKELIQEMKWLRRFRQVAGMTTALFAASSFAQMSPTVQISENGGNATFSWTGTSGLFLLQATTNLSRPVTWTSTLPNWVGVPATNVNVALSPMPQFFRLAQVVPVFQFGVFYNLDLDISPGQPMTMSGAVFADGNIWIWPYASMVFNDSVSAAGTVYAQIQPNDQQATNTYVAPTYNAGEPVSHAGPLVLLAALTNAAQANLFQGFLDLPPGTNGAPNTNAYTANGQIYLFNEVDLIISNSPIGLSGTRGTNITIWFQDPNNPASYLTKLNPDVTNVVAAGVTNKFFSFVTNVQFYDYREDDTVQAVQVDAAKLNLWLTNATGTGGLQWNRMNFADKGHGIDSVYIYNKVPITTSQLPAVRLVNGAQLPYTVDPGGSGLATGGLTVATPQPLYVKGNYNVQTNGGSAGASAGTTNTANTYPAALMGDAITILSANWLDSWTAGTSLSLRLPASTTINAACLAGIVQSTNSGGNNYYSGGLENYLRLEENWSSSTVLTFNGSLVAMFPSIYATNVWQELGNYYNAPTRHWNFDLNFTDLNKLPPLTPMVANFVSP